MNHDRVDFTYKFFEENRERESMYIILHALFNCLTEVEIQYAYFSYGQHSTNFKSTIESFVSKKTTDKPGIAFVEVAKQLLDQLSNESEFRKRLPFRTFLSKIIGDMPIDIIKKYYEIMMRSTLSSDRRKAYEVSSLIWSDEVKSQMINSFKLFFEEKCLEVLIQNLDAKELLQLVKDDEVWEGDYFPRRIKYNIIRKVYTEELSDLDFIKEGDIEAYIFLLSLKRPFIGTEEFESLINQLPDNKVLNKIWFLGLLHQWDSVVHLIDNDDLWNLSARSSSANRDL